MTYIVLTITTLVCAVQAIRARRLLVSALWLAGTSALLATLLFTLGAQFVAVVELSVGAGLVTVLFVFAIAIAGDDALDAPPLPPKPLAIGLMLLVVLLIAWPVLALASQESPTAAGIPFARMFWEIRGLDALVQVVLIFAGVLGMLGLLTGYPASVSPDVRQQITDTAWQDGSSAVSHVASSRYAITPVQDSNGVKEASP